MKILMVCLGNICRSPLAEGILKSKVDELGLDWIVDSAGTSGWHAGELPDPRSIEVADKNELDIRDQRSRKFRKEDFDTYDHIIVMDSQNYQDIIALTNEPKQIEKVSLLLNYLFPNENRAVPDPYLEGGFDHVYQLLDQAIEALISKLKS